jgi:non-ribosomal peptide synthase protein (TIGR01720 family)
VVVHHLAVDAVSWQVLLEDLWKAYQQLRDGDDVALGEKTTSFRRWAHRLETYAGSEELKHELAHWRRQAPARWEALPVDVHEGENLEGTVDRVTVELSPEETEALLREVPRIHRTRVDDVLLGALLAAFHTWTARSWLLVELEGHGREALFEDVDLSRTVGWFTSRYPVLLEAKTPDEPPSALREVKETLRAVPARGIGYGVLRHLSRDPEVADALRDLPEPEVGFNYRGQVAGPRDGDGRFRAAAEPVGRTRSPEERRAHLLDVEGMVMGGRLQVTWLYSRNRHLRATVETLAASYARWLRELVEGCAEEAAPGLTPSDFPEADLTQEELAQLLEDLRAAT